MFSALALLLAQAIAPSPRLSPLTPIAGLAGFESTSEVRFAALADKPHRLTAQYLFPERVRWFLTLDGGTSGERTGRWQRGDQCFALDENVAGSRTVLGVERDELLRSFVLRQALFLWPNGHAWRVEVDQRTCQVAALGELVAVVGPDGRPTRLGWRDSGSLGENLCSIVWKSEQGRWRPASFVLAIGETPQWSERVLLVAWQVRWLDDFFFPPDRRAIESAPKGERGVQALDLPARIERSQPLDAGPTWAGVIERAERHIAEMRDRLAGQGMELEGEPVIEIDWQARPVATWIRLKQSTVCPEGWVRTEESPALTLHLEDPAQVDPLLLAGLLRSVPEGARPGRIHVRRTGKASWQLVLQLDPRI